MTTILLLFGSNTIITVIFLRKTSRTEEAASYCCALLCLQRRWIKRDIGTTLTPTWNLGVKQAARKLIDKMLEEHQRQKEYINGFFLPKCVRVFRRYFGLDMHKISRTEMVVKWFVENGFCPLANFSIWLWKYFLSFQPDVGFPVGALAKHRRQLLCPSVLCCVLMMIMNFTFECILQQRNWIEFWNSEDAS